MAATLEINGLPSGLTLTVELYPYGSDSIANGGGGDSLTEATNRKGLYQATIAETLSGWHTVHVKVGSTLIAGAAVLMVDGQVNRVGDPKQVVDLVADLDTGNVPGSEPVAFVIEDESGNPIEGLRLTLRDVSGNVAAVGTSAGVLGAVPEIESLNPATYTPDAHLSGLWQLVAGQEFEVTEDGENEFVVRVAALSITAPPAGTATGWIRTRNSQQALAAGETVSVVATRPPGPNADGGTGDAPSDEPWTVTSGVSGLAEFPGLLVGWTYRIYGDAIGISEDEAAEFKVPAAALDTTFAIRSFIRRVDS